MDPREDEKRAAAQAAAALIEAGMAVGLGTGSTAAHFLPALAARKLGGLRCVATSTATQEAARALGLPVQPFDLLDRLDIAVDGADQVAADFWLVKGGGGAHTREKIVAAAADRFVVIVSGDKLVERVGSPVPIELLAFGLRATLRSLRELGPTKLRDATPTPDGNALADFAGEIGDPGQLAGRLDATPGVVGHGLFGPTLVSEVIVGKPDGSVDRRVRQ
jgi:ribose 5-phosphate isomerase A